MFVGYHPSVCMHGCIWCVSVHVHVCACYVQVQRYEGGSTTYGPHTLSAYIKNLERLVTDMTKVSDSLCCRF